MLIISVRPQSTPIQFLYREATVVGDIARGFTVATFDNLFCCPYFCVQLVECCSALPQAAYMYLLAENIRMAEARLDMCDLVWERSVV